MKEIFQLIASLKELGYNADRKSEILRAVDDGMITVAEGNKISIYASEN